jgi:hypothetical protein
VGDEGRRKARKPFGICCWLSRRPMGSLFFKIGTSVVSRPSTSVSIDTVGASAGVVDVIVYCWLWEATTAKSNAEEDTEVGGCKGSNERSP